MHSDEIKLHHADYCSYHVPQHLAQHIDYVKPGVLFSPPLTKKTKLRKRQTSEEQALTGLTQIYASEIRNVTAQYLDLIANQTEAVKPALFKQASGLLNKTDTCGSFITPQCLRALYNIPDYVPSDSVNAVGLYESEGQLWDQEDLNSYFETLLEDVPDGTAPNVTSINDAIAEGPTSSAGGETILDLTIAYSLVYPQTVTVFQSQGTAQQNSTYYDDYAGYEALLDAIDGSYCSDADGDAGADCGTAQLTRVFSTSYGTPEIYLPEKASVRMCNE